MPNIKTNHSKNILMVRGSRYLLVVFLAWILGLSSLKLLDLFFVPGSFIFVKSGIGAFFGIIILWFSFKRIFDGNVSLKVILIIFIVKASFVYIMWSKYIFAPGGGESLAVTNMELFHEPYHYWNQINNLIAWWRSQGFSIFPPKGLMNINHPIAMMLVAFPFVSLPAYSEVLIPWNIFYVTATACTVYAIGSLEGFNQRVNKAAFYLVLIQPFGWQVIAPFKRDIQCQMIFGVFLLGILLFRRRVLYLIIIVTMGAIFLSFYRNVYALILVLTAIYAYIFDKGGGSKAYIVRIYMIFIFIVLLFVVFPEKLIFCMESINNLFAKYGVGDISTIKESAYQMRLLRHSSWVGTIPDRVFLGLFSPFPWTNVLSENIPWVICWYLLGYLHTALMLVCFAVYAIFGWRDSKKNIMLPVEVFFSILVACSGMFGAAVHSTYVQIGMLVGLPYVISKLYPRRMLTWFFGSMIFFISTSLLWAVIR